MMLKKSPPKHRHDGTSPLPLGMDWSPPPKRWNGRDTVWPHDPRTGWSYCVTIPSWIVLPESRTSDGSSANTIVEQFYRVQVGVQSPEGVSTARGILRRFSDFLKLFAARRYALEEWMGKLLSDIDLSRSVPVASFLELEAAARSSFQDVNQHNVDRNPHGDSLTSSPQFQPNPGASVAAGSSSDASKALSSTLDYGSDNACETSELGTPRQCSEICADDLMLDQDLAAPMGTLVKYGITTTDNGLFVGDSGLEQLEEFPRNKMHARKEKNVLRGTFNGSASKDAFLSNDTAEFMSEPEHDKLAGHARKLSAESVGSDMSSIRGSELSNAGVTNLLHDNSLNLLGGVEASIKTEAFGNSELQFLNDVHVVLPLDQRNKMNRVLTTMQRRLVTARTDMEDLISRLNQEIAVKEYLTTKVKDLDVELDSTKQKSKENLQQAILIERERVTQMQWDMEELRRKYLEMESKLKFEQDEKIRLELAKVSAIHEKELLLQELDVAREQLKNLQKHQEELEMKSKADIKVLVKEVKFLRKTQTELKQELNQSLKEKAELERILQKEKQRREHAKTARVKLLHECGILRHRLQECSVNFLAEEEDKFTVDSSSLSDALDLLTTSDNRIGLLLAEAQLLAQDDESSISAADRAQGNVNINGDDPTVTDDEVRKMLTDIFIDNARLRKQVNSIIRCALKNVVKPEKEDGIDEAPSRKTVLNKFLER
ncbi:PX domain-containing protein EREL1-like isoform X3 [Magnolia sinica]|uniref:PX domain-containing protein EREL1-like isoform X3 n=1 Tax=Magnolia sinica TaxID=86752 RepID=UPI00265896EE|nr:PX domain-containing protein EREL1-like isoform X3 [Magnolia sinica]